MTDLRTGIATAIVLAATGDKVEPARLAAYMAHPRFGPRVLDAADDVIDIVARWLEGRGEAEAAADVRSERGEKS